MRLSWGTCTGSGNLKSSYWTCSGLNFGWEVICRFTTGSSIHIHSSIGRVTCEVLNLLTEMTLRGVSMSGTEGLRRGERAEVCSGPINVPVGKNTLGRIFNVLGETVDGKGEVAASIKRGIHRDAPPYISLDTTRAIFESGIKVVDG